MPISISILKLHPIPAVCQSFVTLRRATCDNGVLEKKTILKITAANHNGCFALQAAIVNQGLYNHDDNGYE